MRPRHPTGSTRARPRRPLRSDDTVDFAIARVAARQHGVLTRAQLRRAGLGEDAIAYRCDQGSLHVAHRGVYSVGYVASNPRAQAMAAVLACGPGAVLSHGWAAALWDLAGDPRRPVEVTAPVLHRHRGVRLHRSRTLVPADVTSRFGIPVTAPLRTLLDLADVLADRALERAVNEAQLRRLIRREDLGEALAQAQGRRALARLRRFAERSDAPTRSVLEDAFLAFVERHELPRPHVNQRIAGYEVDMLWREHELIVELDGHASHNLARSFERDRERDAELIAKGYRVVRVTWRRLRDRPDREAARLTRLLAR